MRTRGQAGRDALEGRLAAVEAEVEQLREERDRLGGALAEVGDAVIVVDSAGGVVMRNALSEPFQGGRHGDAVAEVVITRLLDEARTGEARVEELSLLGPPTRVLSIRALPLPDGGAVAFIRDITDLRRVESIRRDFVANVSHELKTPIGALALLAETIAAGGDPDAMRQLSERLVREADRLARIVDDLLDLSLVETQEQPARDRVAVGQLVDEAAERIRPALDTRRIRLVVTGDVTATVVCDPVQIVSALANLLDNAAKYSDEGESIEVNASVDGDQDTVIEVRDHGIGIPARDLERVFERFYRVDRARSRTTGGTGLGLSIVRHVVQAHGGHVTVESVEGEGSTFRIVLPSGPSPNGSDR